jgi:hypothetical protein
MTRAIKSRKIIWAGHVARMGAMRNAYNVLVENRKGRRHSEDLCADGRITLRGILKKYVLCDIVD